MKIQIELAGPPIAKGRARAVAIPGLGVRMYPDAKTAKYEDQLRYAATQEMAGRPLIDGPVRLVVVARFAIPTTWSKKKHAEALAGLIRPCVKPDADNTLKICGDGLNMVCWRDDKQVVETSVIKIYAENPGLTIGIATLPLADSPVLAARHQSADPIEALPLFTT